MAGHKPIDWDALRDDIMLALAEELIAQPNGAQRRVAKRFGIKPNTMTAWLNNNNDTWDLVKAVVEHVRVDATVDPLPADHPMIRELERSVTVLRDETKMLRTKLKQADQAVNVTEQLIDVMRDEIQPLEPRTLEIVKRAPGAYPVDGVALLSDEHADKVVSPAITMGMEDFDFDMFRERLSRYARTLIAFVTHHLPMYAYERLWIFKLGDTLQGDIHDSKLRNYFANTMKAAVAVADAEAEFVAALAPYFPKGVHLVSVSGNHARTTIRPQHEDPTDSTDYLITAGIAARLRRLIEEGQVTVHAPPSWGAIVDVRGWLNFIGHGDDVQGWAGFPWYGFDRKENKVKAMFSRMLDRPIDVFCHGHYHTPAERTTADSVSIHNGAFYMTAGWELKKLAVAQIPRQEFLTFQDREEDRGYVFKAPIYLRNRQREREVRMGERVPTFGRQLTVDVIEGSGRAVAGITPIIRAEED